MEVILLRHAEVESNRFIKKRVPTEEELTDLGKVQSQTLPNALIKFGIDKILSSPLPRAIRTIEPFLYQSKLELNIIPELAEGHLILQNNVT